MTESEKTREWIVVLQQTAQILLISLLATIGYCGTNYENLSGALFAVTMGAVAVLALAYGGTLVLLARKIDKL
ncbi:hypothetical protein FACS189487_03050 [Campylobacterota bacterium]|nr:hypothetical protein FACS189487_03050 [Campylobacterota bacterium]